MQIGPLWSWLWDVCWTQAWSSWRQVRCSRHKEHCPHSGRQRHWTYTPRHTAYHHCGTHTLASTCLWFSGCDDSVWHFNSHNQRREIQMETGRIAEGLVLHMYTPRHTAYHHCGTHTLASTCLWFSDGGGGDSPSGILTHTISGGKFKCKQGELRSDWCCTQMRKGQILNLAALNRSASQQYGFTCINYMKVC